jgi:hypothetical protein
MKQALLIWVLCCAGAMQAQQAHPEPTPITRQEALKLNNIFEIIGIPATDSILSGKITALSRKSEDVEPWKPAKGMADPVIAQFITPMRPGERLIFSDFIVLENGKQVKVPKKVYVIK